jgi:hypothetical protein
MGSTSSDSTMDKKHFRPGIVVANTYNPSYWGGRGRRILSWRPVQAKLVRLYLKNKCKIQKQKQAGAWLKVQSLLSMVKALGLTSSTTK